LVGTSVTQGSTDTALQIPRAPKAHCPTPGFCVLAMCKPPFVTPSTHHAQFMWVISLHQLLAVQAVPDLLRLADRIANSSSSMPLLCCPASSPTCSPTRVLAAAAAQTAACEHAGQVPGLHHQPACCCCRQCQGAADASTKACLLLLSGGTGIQAQQLGDGRKEELLQVRHSKGWQVESSHKKTPSRAQVNKAQGWWRPQLTMCEKSLKWGSKQKHRYMWQLHAPTPTVLPLERQCCSAQLSASSCVSERRMLEGPRNSCILPFQHVKEHNRIYQPSVAPGQRLPSFDLSSTLPRSSWRGRPHYQHKYMHTQEHSR